jgi:drug/metabolite transporter (DMT)-like permease
VGRTPLPATGLALLAFITLGWGLNWPAMKIALAEIEPWTYRAAMGTGGAICLFLLALALRQSLKVPRREWPTMVVAALLNFTIWQAAVAYGVAIMQSGQASVIAFTMPLWAVLFGAIFLGERLGPRKLLGVALGVGGIVMLATGAGDSAAIRPLGVVFVLIGAISWAAGTVYIKHARFSTPVIALAAWQVAIGTAPMILIAWLLEDFRIGHASGDAVAAMAFTVLIPFVLCYAAWFKVISLFPASVASVGILLVPVVAVFSGALILGEDPGWTGYAALVLVLAALYLVLLRPDKEAPG